MLMISLLLCCLFCVALIAANIPVLRQDACEKKLVPVPVYVEVDGRTRRSKY
jgi:hypothetical protein